MLDEALQGVVKVTVAFTGLYFCFLLFQSFSKFYAFGKKKAEAKKRGEKAPSLKSIKYGGKGGRLGLTGDRTVGNTMEQSLVFLPLLWLAALNGNSAMAEYYGWMWLAFRFIYPFVFYMGIPWLFLSTVPGYLILARLGACALGYY